MRQLSAAGRLVRAQVLVLLAGLGCGSERAQPDRGECVGDDCGSGSPCGASTCLDGEACETDSETCLPVCPIPNAQLLSVVHVGAELTFGTGDGRPVQVGLSTDPQASEPREWLDRSTLRLGSDDVPQTLKVFARVADPSCVAVVWFEHLYQVREAYLPAAGQEQSAAVGPDDSRISGWASGWVSPVAWGSEVEDQWKTPELALGQAQGTALDIVTLGRGGEIVMTFDPPISNGPGSDLAIFENGATDTFLELAFVEVSSDGVHFVRFDSGYMCAEPVSAFGALDPTCLSGLAGKYRQGFGTPFDLELLRYAPLVQSGVVELSAITQVRLVDIVGDGSATDSFGNPIYDPYPTVGSAGFDLDAIAVLGEGGS